MIKPLKYTVEEAIEAIKTSQSLGEAIKKCGQQRNYITFRKIIKEYGVDVSHWEKEENLNIGGFKKGHKMQVKPLEEIMVKNSSYKGFNLKQRLFNARIFEKKCCECGRAEYMNKPIPLEIDHINGNNKDHRLENIRIVCCNCHSQFSTYCTGKRGIK